MGEPRRGEGDGYGDGDGGHDFDFFASKKMEALPIIMEALGEVVSDVDEVDEDVVEYLSDIVETTCASAPPTPSLYVELYEAMGPFLEQLGPVFEPSSDSDSDDEASFTASPGPRKAFVVRVADAYMGEHVAEVNDELALLSEAVVVSQRDEDVLRKGNVMLKGSAESAALRPERKNLAAVQREQANADALAKAEAKAAAKAARAQAKAKAAAAAQAQAEADAIAAGILASHISLAGTGKLTEREQASRDIAIEGFQMAYGGKVLLDNADLKLAFGRRYGLIGRNGVGKSTLLRHLAAGDLPIPRTMTKLYVAQEIEGSDDTALEAVLQADTVRAGLLEDRAFLLAADAGSDVRSPSGLSLGEVETRLAEIEAEAAPARAARILHGLQFTPEMQNRKTSDFSGGWRMRIALARALFNPPDLFIADEITNHLDLHACVWLEEFLTDWPTTLLVVSHDQSFLDAVCTDVIHQANGKLTYYKGNYSAFVTTAEERRKVHERAYKNQQADIEHMEKFVEKFRFKAKGSKMAQSRLKKLEKMDRIEALEDEAEVRLEFGSPEPLDATLLQFQDVSFGYNMDRAGPSEVSAADSVEPEKDTYILKHVNTMVQMKTRVTLVGANGAGKSTWLKLAAGVNEPTEGYIIRPNKLRIAMFEQHFVEALDLSMTPLEFFKSEHPEVERQDLRAYLGRFGLGGELAMQVMRTLSGGQKVRVIFAKIAWSNPHLMLLDEPSNHVDVETVNALIDALNAFEGAVIMVTHDQRLIENVCNEIWLCEGGAVRTFDGGFAEYRQVLMADLGLA